MQKEILDYIASQRVGVLAVEMLDGSPHAASVHFAHSKEPLSFFFETRQQYRKAEPILKKEIVKASFVLGIDEEIMKTFQADGEIRLIRGDEKGNYDAIYFGKFPEKKDKASDPEIIRMVFIPNWWRYTNWKSPTGKLILESE